MYLPVTSETRGLALAIPKKEWQGYNQLVTWCYNVQLQITLQTVLLTLHVIKEMECKITGKYNADIFQVFLTIPESDEKNRLPTDVK